MRKHRFYHAEPLILGNSYVLNADNSHQVSTVLRLKPTQIIWLFNNTPYEFTAKIDNVTKRVVTVTVLTQIPVNNESPCKIHLAQAIAKGQKMDYIVQKAVELGVHAITPLFSERTIVTLAAEKISQRLEHWQKIVSHACCQCGRCIVPVVYQPKSLQEWITSEQTAINVLLDPTSSYPLAQLPIKSAVNLLIGPEGGFSQAEIDLAIKHNCQPVSLGPRILRTETASIVAITGLQMQYGDLK